MKPAKDAGCFGARSGGIGNLASANGTSVTVVAKGKGHAARVPDASFGKSVPLSVARSLSSGHLNLSQPTGSWARAGMTIDKKRTTAGTIVAALTAMPFVWSMIFSENRFPLFGIML